MARSTAAVGRVSRSLGRGLARSALFYLLELCQLGGVLRGQAGCPCPDVTNEFVVWYLGELQSANEACAPSVYIGHGPPGRRWPRPLPPSRWRGPVLRDWFAGWAVDRKAGRAAVRDPSDGNTAIKGHERQVDSPRDRVRFMSPGPHHSGCDRGFRQLLVGRPEHERGPLRSQRDGAARRPRARGGRRLQPGRRDLQPGERDLEPDWSDDGSARGPCGGA